MTPARFTKLAERIAGSRWKTRLPALIGRSRWMVWAYATGREPVSPIVATLMEALAAQSTSARATEPRV